MSSNADQEALANVVASGGGNSQAFLRIDYNHPLFLHPSDIGGIHIITLQLTSIENYSIWFRSMRRSLLGRNKLELVDDSCKKEDFLKLCAIIGKGLMP